MIPLMYEQAQKNSPAVQPDRNRKHGNMRIKSRFTNGKTKKWQILSTILKTTFKE